MFGPTSLCPDGIGLIFLDLDDTVVADGVRVSPRVIDAVKLARERGCMMCVASGRPAAMVPTELAGPDVMDYLVCANGARVYDVFGGVLYDRPMTSAQVLVAMDALAPLRPGWNAFIGDEAFFEWRSFSYMMSGRGREHLSSLGSDGHLRPGMARLAVKATRFARRMVTDRDGRHQVRSIRPAVERATGGVLKVGCSLSSAAVCDRAQVTLEHMGDYEVVRMTSTELEVTARGVTKGAAASWLMDYLGEPRSRAVAFGDSSNDLPLASACGVFVAMGNADDAVKQAADDVCESVYDDGVARWIERAMAQADGAAHVRD